MARSIMLRQKVSRTFRPELSAASTVGTEVRGLVSVGLGPFWPVRLLYPAAVQQRRLPAWPRGRVGGADDSIGD
jgi:hypothetical protein